MHYDGRATPTTYGVTVHKTATLKDIMRVSSHACRLRLPAAFWTGRPAQSPIPLPRTVRGREDSVPWVLNSTCKEVAVVGGWVHGVVAVAWGGGWGGHTSCQAQLAQLVPHTAGCVPRSTEELPPRLPTLPTLLQAAEPLAGLDHKAERFLAVNLKTRELLVSFLQDTLQAGDAHVCSPRRAATEPARYRCWSTRVLTSVRCSFA